jgi:hypothetical protein
MSEALTSHQPAEVKPLSEVPEIKVLEDGSKLLAETKAFLVRNASKQQTTTPTQGNYRSRSIPAEARTNCMMT